MGGREVVPVHEFVEDIVASELVRRKDVPAPEQSRASRGVRVGEAAVVVADDASVKSQGQGL